MESKDSTRNDREEFQSMLERMGVPHRSLDDARVRADAEKDGESVRAWGEEYLELALKIEHMSLAGLATDHNAPPELAARARAAVVLHDGELLFLFGPDGEYLGYGCHDLAIGFYPAPREGV